MLSSSHIVAKVTTVATFQVVCCPADFVPLEPYLTTTQEAYS
jgi:hypothetical protein